MNRFYITCCKNEINYS